MSIGAVLREQRTTLGLTVAQAAGRGGVTRSYLSMVETGQRAPNPEVLVRFTQALGIPTEAWLPAFLEDEWRGQRLVSLGRALYETRRHAAARTTLVKALLVSRNRYDGRFNSEIYLLLGKVRYAEGRYLQAQRWFLRLAHAVRHSPDLQVQGTAAFNLAQCLRRTGRELDALLKFDEAAEAFRDLGLWPFLGLVWLAKANLLLARSTYAESQNAYRRAEQYLKGQSFHGDALLGVAIATIFVQGPATAVPLFRNLIDDESTELILRAKARENLAVALRLMGLYSDAVCEVHLALKARDQITPNLVAALLAEEALCYARMGDLTSARRTVDEYKTIPGERDGQDVAAMRILARVLSVEPPQELVAGTVADEHERHMSEALRILQTAPSRWTDGSQQRSKRGPSSELA